MSRFVHRSAFLLIACLCLVGTPGLAEISFDKHLRPGDIAPRFRFSEVKSGEQTSFATVAPDRPLIVIFLETACRSCVREVLALKRISQKVPKLGVIGVFLDMKDRDLKQYIADYELPFPFAWDPDLRVAQAYGVTVTPVCFLVDVTGKIQKVYQGFRLGMEKEMLRDIEALGAPR